MNKTLIQSDFTISERAAESKARNWQGQWPPALVCWWMIQSFIGTEIWVGPVLPIPHSRLIIFGLSNNLQWTSWPVDLLAWPIEDSFRFKPPNCCFPRGISFVRSLARFLGRVLKKKFFFTKLKTNNWLVDEIIGRLDLLAKQLRAGWAEPVHSCLLSNHWAVKSRPITRACCVVLCVCVV